MAHTVKRYFTDEEKQKIKAMAEEILTVMDNKDSLITAAAIEAVFVHTQLWKTSGIESEEERKKLYLECCDSLWDSVFDGQKKE